MTTLDAGELDRLERLADAAEAQEEWDRQAGDAIGELEAACDPDTIRRLVAAAREPLDAAWAEVEAALPEGAWVGTIHPEDESNGEYAGPLNRGSDRIAFVAVRRIDGMSAEYIAFESGPTPAAALRALAEALRKPVPA